MSDSWKKEFIENLVTRLQSITEANGYGVTVREIYADDIPMAIDLERFNLPAILVLDSEDRLIREHQILRGRWQIELQLVADEENDSYMNKFVRAVMKSIFANNPTAQKNDAFKALSCNVFDMECSAVIPDLNMIEANRLYQMIFLVHYHARNYNF